MTTKTYDTIDPNDFPDLNQKKGQQELNPDDFPDLKKKGGSDSVKLGGGLNVPQQAPIAQQPDIQGIFEFRKIQKRQGKLKAVDRFNLQDFNVNVYAGDVSGNELSDANESGFAQPTVEKLIQEYAPDMAAGGWEKGSPQWDELAKRIKTKNRVNAKSANDTFINQANNEIGTAISNYYTTKRHVGAGTGGGGISFSTAKLPQVDLNDPEQFGRLVTQLENSDDVSDAEGRVIPGQKQRLLTLLSKKAANDVLQNGVDNEVVAASPMIKDAIARANLDREKGENIPLNQFALNDQLNQEHFQLGMSLIKRADPARYKNVMAVIEAGKNVPDDDFRTISDVGQDLKNQQIFFGAADNPELLDKETDLDYSTRGEKKALYAGIIAERLKIKTGAPFNTRKQYTEAEIRSVSKDLDNQSIVDELVFEEKLPLYDAIPKYGPVERTVQGLWRPIESIRESFRAITMSPVDYYIRSKKLDTGTVQKTFDEQGNVGDVIPSQRGNIFLDAVQGGAEFIPQILLSKGIGSGLTKGVGAVAKLSPAAARGISAYGGTFISTFLQEYGGSYADYIQKTGDYSLARLGGTIDGISASLWELLLPDVKIADKAMLGLRKNLVKDIVDLVKKGGDVDMLKKAGRGFVEKFVKEGINISGQEIAEEVGTTLTDAITEAIFSPQTAANRNVKQEVWETIKQTAIQMSIPAIFGGAGAGFNPDFTQQAFHGSAINLESSKQALTRALNDNAINQEEYNKSLNLLSTHKQSLQAAPRFDVNNNPIDDQDQLDYALEDTKIKELQAKAANATGVNKQMLEQKIKQSEEVQRGIAMPSDAERARRYQLRSEIDRWKENIVAISNRTDIDETEKENLKQQEDKRHAEEISSINKSKTQQDASVQKGEKRDSETKVTPQVQPESGKKDDSSVRSQKPETLTTEGAAGAATAAPSLSDDELLTNLRKNAPDTVKNADLQYFMDKAGEDPANFIETHGLKTSRALLNKLPIEKLEANSKDIKDKYGESETTVYLDQIVKQRREAEAKAATKEYTEAEKLQIQADKLTMEANSLPPEQMDRKNELWAEAAKLREQAKAMPTTTEDVAPSLKDVSDAEYNEFIDKGKVSEERLNDIADKVKNQQPLSDREKEIFTDKTGEVNKIIAQQTKVSPTPQSQKGDVVPSLKDVGSFETSKGSVYTVGEDGKTSRFKTKTGEQHEPQDLTVFAKFEGQQNDDYLQALHGHNGESVHVAGIIDGKVQEIKTNEDAARATDIKLIIADKDGKITQKINAVTTPTVGYSVYDQRSLGENKYQKHIGNEVTKVTPKQTKVSPTTDGKTADQTADELQHTYGNKLPQLLSTINDFDLFDEMSIDDVGETTGRAKRIADELADDNSGVLDIPAVKAAVKELMANNTPENIQQAKDVIKNELNKITGKDQLVKRIESQGQQQAETTPEGKPKVRVSAEQLEKAQPVTSKPVETQEPPNKKGRVTVTLSGNTEKERQELIKQRKKETYIPTAVREEQKLLDRVEAFNAQSKNKRKNSLGVQEVNKIKLAVDQYNRTYGQAYKAVQNRQGQIEFKNAKGRKIGRSNKYQGDLSIDETGKPLLQRDEKVNEVFQRFLEAEVFPTGYTVDGRRMSESQLDGTIQDILDGIPSRAANNYLDALEKMAKNDAYDFSVSGALETQQRDLTLDEATSVTKETIGEPMTPEAIEAWMNEQGTLTPEQEQTVVDNIENLLTEYEQGIRIVDQDITDADSGVSGQVQPVTGESEETVSGETEQDQQPETELTEDKQAAQARREAKIEKFNEKADKVADAAIDFLNKLIKPKTDTGGADVMGLDIEAIVRAGMDVVKAAYRITQNVQASVEAGLSEMKRLWNQAGSNIPFPEDDLKDHLNKNFTPRKYAAQQQAAQSAATADDLIIAQVLGLNPSEKDFPTIFQNNQTKKQETAETTGDVQQRLVDGAYVVALQTDLQEIAVQSSLQLQQALGPNWGEKTLGWIERNPDRGNLAQIVAVLNTISTENNDAIQASTDPNKISQLRKIQKRIDVATNRNARIASLALNQRRLLRKFASGNNMIDVLTGAVLTPEMMDMQDELNAILSEEVSDEEINNAQPIQQTAPPPKKTSAIRRVAAKAKSIVSKQNTALKDELKTRGAAAATKSGKNLADIINDVNNKIKKVC